MPDLTIGDKTVTIDDGFLKLSPEQQNSTVEEIASQIGAKAAPAPVSTNDVVRATATGVPIIGGALNKLDAATNATLAPLLNRFFDEKDQLPEASFSDRMAHSLRDQEGGDKRFAEQHPIVNTGAQVAGSIASMAPAMAAAPAAFGLTGTIPQMVARGAASGAALSAADAAVRGENPLDAAVSGGIIGGVAGPVGKGVGKVVSAIADRVRPPAPAVQNFSRVGDVEIPMSGPQVSQNPADSAEAQIIARGGRGDAAQERATAFNDRQQGAVNDARDQIAAGLDPTGASAGTAPQDAAERVASELIAQEQARQASKAGAAGGEMSPLQTGQDLHRSFAPDGQVRAVTPADAGENLSDAFAAARNAAKTDYRGKYDRVAEQPGEFAPGSAAGFRNDVERGLSNADRPVSLDPTNTPKALNALDVIDRRMNAAGPGRPAATAVGELGPDHASNVDAIREKFGDKVAAAYDRQKQAAGGAGFPGDRVPAPKVTTSPNDIKISGSGFTMRDVEQVRKELSTHYGDARRAMMAGGSGSDVHALEHITDAFDARVRQMVADGKFSGDGPAVLKMQEDARKSFADYKQKFAKRGAGDDVGAAVEKILGKFSDTKATPAKVVELAYGSESRPGGDMAVKVAQRILKIFGPKSEEFGTYKQGLFAQLTRGEPEAAASRIDEFLTGTKGRLLSHTAFDAGERAQLARHANRLRSMLPGEVEKGPAAAAIRRVTGADGAPAGSSNEIVNKLFGATGKGNNAAAVPLAAELKRTLSPEGWTAVRQGMFDKLTKAGNGKIEFEAQALSQRMHEFLNESGSQLAKTMFSPKELTLMRDLASVYKQMIPVKGTTNPSGTAPMLAKMAGGIRKTLLPLLGFTHGGLPGAALAMGADKAVTAIGNANNARKATELLYGPQARRAVDPRFAKGFGMLAQGDTGERNQRRVK